MRFVWMLGLFLNKGDSKSLKMILTNGKSIKLICEAVSSGIVSK